MNASAQRSTPTPPVRVQRTGLALITLLGSTAAALLLVLVCFQPVQAQGSIIIDITPEEQWRLSGQRATFALTITMPNTITYTYIAVSGSIGSTGCSKTFISPNPGAVITYTCQSDPLPASDIYINQPLVIAYPAGSGNPVTATATARVHLSSWMWIEPEIQEVDRGEAAMLTVVLSNTSSSILTDIAVTDLLAPDCERGAGTLGDLIPGATMTYTCQTEPVLNRLENGATATALSEGSQLGGKSLNILEIATPLDVTVTPDRQRVSPGAAAALVVTVKNKGDATLTDVTVLAPEAPDCERPAGSLFDIAPGNTLSYACKTLPAAIDTTQFVTVTASKEGIPGIATGDALVQVATLVDIAIDPPYQRTLPGMLATFLVTVTNLQASQTLSNAVVLAPDVPDCARDSIPDLAPQTSYTYTCQAQTWRKIANVVTAMAVDPALPTDADPIGIMDSAAAGVEVYRLPLIFKHFGHGPDLIVDHIAATRNTITVTIKNEGTTPIADAFWVDLYFDPSSPPSLNQTWPTLAPAGAVWGVTQSLAPGESLTLTTGDAYYFGPPESSAPPFPIGVPVYALVDSVNADTSYGMVQEIDEGNNLGGPVISTLDTSEAPVTGQSSRPLEEGLPAR